MKALVTRELNQYAVEDVTLDPPKAGELRIKMGATGVCHSDLSVINGTLPLGKPMVLGHEGAGVVAEIGAGVTGFTVGDHVVLSFAPACGVCSLLQEQAAAVLHDRRRRTAACSTAPRACTTRAARTSA